MFQNFDHKKEIISRIASIVSNSYLIKLIVLFFIITYIQNFFVIHFSKQMKEDHQPSLRPNKSQRKELKIQSEGSQLNVKLFHEKYIGTSFNLDDKFSLDVNQVPPTHPHYNLIKLLKFEKTLIPNSIFDYENVSKRVNFSRLADQLFERLPYYQFTFNYKEGLQKIPQILQIKHFPTDNLQEKGSKDTMATYVGVQIQNKNFTFELAQKLEDPTEQLLESQYVYFNHKYKIGKQQNQIPICVYSGGQKVWTKKRFIEFFETLQTVNYTNFHIVYLDDNSPKNQIINIISYLENSNSRIKNRIKIIQTLEHIQSTGNIPFFIKKYCNKGDVVLVLDPDDALLGRQVFKVINSIFVNKQIWFAYSLMLSKLIIEKKLVIRPGTSKKLSVKNEDYRYKILWQTSAMRIFRYELFIKIPWQSVIDYRVNGQQKKISGETKKAYPYFPKYASDMPEYLSLLQMSGEDHTLYINDYLYLYYGSTMTMNYWQCGRGFQIYDDIKFRVRNPIKKMKNLEDQIQFGQFNTKITQFNQKITKYYFESDCLSKIHHPTSRFYRQINKIIQVIVYGSLLIGGILYELHLKKNWTFSNPQKQISSNDEKIFQIPQ